MNAWEALAATLGVVALAIAVVGLGWLVLFLAAYFRQRITELREPDVRCKSCGHSAQRHPGDRREWNSYCTASADCRCDLTRSEVLRTGVSA